MNSKELAYEGCPTNLQVFTQLKNLRILANVVPLLTLGIMGGAILPVPSAFATSGIIASAVSMVVIAFCMVYTCDLLLWQAYTLRVRDYETLAQAVGGKWYRIFTEVWLVILMIGTLLGSIVQVGETCASGILFINPNAPADLVNGSGRWLMVIGVILMSGFVFLKHLRQLEYAGDAGVIVVFIMVVIIVVRSIQLGLPAISNGEFAIVGFSNLDAFGSAISTYGFMFYIQPVMMPILDEMPKGKYGVKLLSWAARLAICGTAFSMYYLAGFFGAAAFGAQTSENILENSLLTNTKAQGALNIFMSAYIAIGLVPFEWACRHSVDSLVVQAFPHLNQPKYVMARKVGEAFFVYGLSLGIALAIPGTSGQIIAVTGATGVLVVCYAIPLANHYILWFGRASVQQDPSRHASITKAVRFTDPTELAVRDDSARGATMAAEDLESLKDQPEVVTLPRDYPLKDSGLLSKAFYLLLPPLILGVGVLASILTLKGLADS